MKNRIKKGIALFSAIILGIVIFQFSGKATNSIENELAQQQAKTAEINKNEVCMVNDAFMGAPQIEVPVNGKMYYGCCKMCVGKLNNSEDIRTAVDPHTNEKVDKASAFIVLDPDSDQDAVMYFKNEKNYKDFINGRE